MFKAKYAVNFFNGEVGTFYGTRRFKSYKDSEIIIRFLLKKLMAVEFFNVKTNKPIANYKGKFINSDIDGFCFLKKES